MTLSHIDNIDEIAKKKASTLLPSASYNPETHEISGYKFKEDKIANIIAYCFGGNDKNKDKLDEILKGAEAIEDKTKKKKYIEEQVREHAGSIDNSIKGSIAESFAEAQKKYKEQNSNGKITPEGDQMLSKMQSFGLNVNPDNFTTSYQEGPNGNPKVYTMVWVNRPTAEMADEKSQQNKLAQQYGDCLEGKEKTDFKSDIERHQQDARNGGPIIAKDEFTKKADEISTQAFQDASRTQDPEYRKQMAMAQAQEIAKGLADGTKRLDQGLGKIVDTDPLAQAQGLSARAAPASPSASQRGSLLGTPQIGNTSASRTGGFGR